MGTVVWGTNGSETLDGADGAGSGMDEIWGLDGDDWLYGLGGNDLLVGGKGADHLDGGAGFHDKASYIESTKGVQVSLSQGKGFGGEADGDVLKNIEDVHGSLHADILVGDQKDNHLYGDAGSDTLKGGGGADWLYGGDGNDNLVGGAGADWIHGGDGIDTVNYSESGIGVYVDLAVGGFGGDAQSDTYLFVENITGSIHGDHLIGDKSNNVIAGLGGIDHITGGAGNDVIEGGAGADQLYGDEGIDTLSYASSKAAVAINLGNGTATGGDAQGDSFATFESIIGTAYADTLIGDASANTIEGGAGADKLDGGGDVNTLSYAGSKAGVVINLGNGMAQGGDATGDSYKNFTNVIGSAQADSLFGNGLGNQLRGGGGNDFLYGGLGADMFDFTDMSAKGSGQTDTVLDFKLGEDKIVLNDDIVPIVFAELKAGMVQDGADVVITLHTDKIVLQNVDLDALQASDFMLL